MASSRWLKVFAILFFQYVLCKAAPYGCGPGVKSAGYTYPPGDITLKLGQDLDILCILNEEGAAIYGANASQHMHFMMGDTVFPTEIVNSTAIRLHIENHPSTSNSDYYCSIHGKLVCHNIVTVGTPPQDVTDFDCIGLNYENFTCSWTAPKNYVETDYELNYTPDFRPARYYKSHHKAKTSSKPMGTTPTVTFAYRCPSKLTVKKENGTTTLSCTWDLGTKPQYRHSHDNFTFKLLANNTFGSRTWEFRVQHFTRVRPNQPEELVAIGTTPHSIKLKWSIPLYMISFPKGLEHRVSWWIEHNKKWTTVYLRDVKVDRRIVEYELENLPYAHCLYDIRVAIKSELATEERMWSQNASRTVWTQSKIPDCPPNTTAGSFELLEGTGKIRVFWQNIYYYQENGENFSYYIKVDEDPNMQPVKLQNNHAEFENLPERNYTFRIWSKNSVGKSSESSVVFFPAPKYALRQLSKLVKVDKGNGEYDLEWTESSDPRVTNYTLFWCSSQKERPHACDGTLQWETVPRGIKNKTLKLPTYDEKNQAINIYQFAISANGFRTSSGLLWADCTVIPGAGVKLRQTYVKKVSPRFIVLQWKLECIKLADIQSFNVSYCKLMTSQECQPNSMKYQIFDNRTFGVGEGELNITGLKPYTGYKIRVKPIILGVKSQFSDPMFNTTWEDAPSEPRNLKVLNKTDRGMWIQWEKPLEENGHLTSYYIQINGASDKPISVVKDQIVYKEFIGHLLPRTDYTINVRACTTTTSCSASSIRTYTDIGVPGNVSKPSANWDNYTLIVKWEKPDEIGVKVDFYEVQVGTTKDPESHSFYNTTNQSFKISLCQHDKSQTINVSIRAVNLKKGEQLVGNWSEIAHFPCFPHPGSSTWIIPLVVMSVIVFIVLMSYLVKKIWHKVLNMRNCGVKLPPALDAVINSDQKEKHADETLPGEPLLPEKFPNQPKNPSGETSGCCSATESVASSVESAGHLSMSDSGTEQPRSPSLADSEHKDVNLRQRPNVKKTDYVSMTDIPPAPWFTKPNQSGYSVIGLSTPPKKPDLESEYMPLSDIPAKSSYVPFPIAQPQETVKEPVARPPTSGYVPYLPQEPASKNTAYVLAGEPTAAKPAPKLTPQTSSYMQKEDSSSGYVKAPPIDAPKLLFPWQQAPLEPPSTGYVVVGDTKPQKVDLSAQKGSSKGYVPHNLKFETSKSLKED